MRHIALPVVAALGAATLFAIVAPSASAVVSGSRFVSTTPTRVLDTRNGAYGNRKGAVGARGHVVVKVVGTSGVPTTAAGVVVTISVVAATRGGAITASTYGARTRPNVTNVQFAAGGTATDLAVVKPTSGRVDLWNASDGRVQLVMDVVGYYAGGTPTVDGAMHLRTPKRVVDTRSGLNGFHHGALRAGTTMSPNLRTLAGLPGNAGAVAATVTVIGPTRSGSLVADATHTTRPAAPLLDFTAGRAVSQYAVLPLSDIQGLSLYNTSSGSMQVTIDVVGFLTDAPAATSGGVQVVAANRIYGDTSLPARSSDVVPVLGRGGVPRTGVAAVALTVRVRKPARSGSVVGGPRRAPTVVSFGAGRNASGQVVLRVVNGAITLRNASPGALGLEVDVVGYVPSTTRSVPTAKSAARYPNDLTGDVPSDETTMAQDGTADAAAGATFALLDLGAQTVHSPLSATNPGIAIALTSPTVRIAYPDLVAIIKAYIDGLATGGRPVTLAVGTNNDGDWSSYRAWARGAQFANKVIDPLVAYGSPLHVAVVGANDIEANFGSHKAGDAVTWENAYLANTPADLVFNGALNDCPTVFGSSANCAYGWTQKQYGTLTRHVEGSRNRIGVLPQIYFAVQAVQWANIYAHAGGPLRFVGALTQFGADPGTYQPRRGWAALVRALQWRVATPSVPRMIDITPDV
jgi:hypothetical protein